MSHPTILFVYGRKVYHNLTLLQRVCQRNPYHKHHEITSQDLILSRPEFALSCYTISLLERMTIRLDVQMLAIPCTSL